MKPKHLTRVLCVASVLCAAGPSASPAQAIAPPMTVTESNRLAAALAAIAPRATGIMPHSNLGILLADAETKDTLAGGCCPAAIPLYERVARALTNACIHPATNATR